MSSQIMQNVFCPLYWDLSSEKIHSATRKNVRDRSYNYAFVFKQRFDE